MGRLGGGSGGLTYAASGVPYDTVDACKRCAQDAARTTSITRDQRDLLDPDPVEIPWSRGESAFLTFDRHQKAYRAHVHEGLGTKNIVTEHLKRLFGVNRFSDIGQDLLAMAINDLLAVGARPVSAAMHLAVGSADWFRDTERYTALMRGFAAACKTAGVIWGPGETPILKDIVSPLYPELSVSATGFAYDGDLFHSSLIADGDKIVLLASSGIHANGLTLARAVAERNDALWRRALRFFFPSLIPRTYLAHLMDVDGKPLGGERFGEALLAPTVLYTDFFRVLREQGVRLNEVIHYAINVTGHGWRKLMRAEGVYECVIEEIPAPQPVFQFIQKKGGVATREMYATLNMGAGFALIVNPAEVTRVVKTAAQTGNAPLVAGYVSKGDLKRVTIKPLGIVFGAGELAIR